MIARSITGGAELELGGERWWLRMTYRVLIECEEAAGVEMLTGAALAQPSARLIRVLLWVALRAAGAVWSEREVGAMLRPGTIGRVHEAVLEAWRKSMPAPTPTPAGSGKAGEGRSPDEALTWLEAWAVARQRLGLSDEEWLEMTPRQLHALRQVQLEEMRREELMNGVVAATVANFGYRAPKRALRAEAFMLHPFERDSGPLTGEKIMAVMGQLRAQMTQKAS